MLWIVLFHSKNVVRDYIEILALRVVVEKVDLPGQGVEGAHGELEHEVVAYVQLHGRLQGDVKQVPGILYRNCGAERAQRPGLSVDFEVRVPLHGRRDGRRGHQEVVVPRLAGPLDAIGSALDGLSVALLQHEHVLFSSN
jgi:hypothetical protein